jgi:phosphoserine phosphatase RsbX
VGVPEGGRPPLLEWGAATRACRGEVEAGDLAVVTRNARGTLVAAIDGSGHGSPAAEAAEVGARVVRAHAGEDLFALVVRCHEALRSTRGAAISMAFFPDDQGAMEWLGIGNVEGRVFGGDGADPRPKSALLLASGVVGHELPTVTRETLELSHGDVLVFSTDGIRPSFVESLRLAGSPQEIAERVADDHWRPRDDGLVLVVRYLG